MRLFFLARTLMMSVCLVCASVSALPASAQSKKEMIAKDIQLEQRIVDLEGRMLTGDPAAERLMQRMDTLETAQRSLTGEIEQLRYERDTLRTDLEALAKDITDMQAMATQMNSHLQGMSMGQPAAPVYSESHGQPHGQFNGQSNSQSYVSAPPYQGANSAFPAAAVQPLGPQTFDASELQEIGQQKLRAGDFSGAQQAFSQYIQVNPSAPDLGEAYFWLGETYFVKSGFDKAAESYIESMRASPEGPFASSAMIGLAGALRGMDNADGACKTLAGFSVQFPNASQDMQVKANRERQRSNCS